MVPLCGQQLACTATQGLGRAPGHSRSRGGGHESQECLRRQAGVCTDLLQISPPLERGPNSSTTFTATTSSNNCRIQAAASRQLQAAGGDICRTFAAHLVPLGGRRRDGGAQVFGAPHCARGAGSRRGHRRPKQQPPARRVPRASPRRPGRCQARPPSRRAAEQLGACRGGGRSGLHARPAGVASARALQWVAAGSAGGCGVAGAMLLVNQTTAFCKSLTQIGVSHPAAGAGQQSAKKSQTTG